MTNPPVRTWTYGEHPDQFVRLHVPAGRVERVAVVVHGGFWRAAHGVELADPLAADLAGHGVAALAVEYRRVGRGGGWPATADDIAAAVDSLATRGREAAGGVWPLDRVIAVGHSAGGHLAAWLSGRTGAAPSGAGGPVVPVRDVVSQAGVLDLAAAARAGLGGGAVQAFLGGPPAAVPDRYLAADPSRRVGGGARVHCVHGDADDVVPLSQSQAFVAAAVGAGDPATLTVLPGVDHMALVDPDGPAWAVCRELVLAADG